MSVDDVIGPGPAVRTAIGCKVGLIAGALLSLPFTMYWKVLCVLSMAVIGGVMGCVQGDEADNEADIRDIRDSTIQEV
jgi:hypothetical protein